MKKSTSKTIVWITGAFVTMTCWDGWKSYFEAKGYECIIPTGPYKEASAEVLRSRHPNAQLAAVGLRDLTDYYAQIIQTLPEKPIVIGHSIGGLIVQLLMERGLVSAGVALHPAPPQWVFTFQWSFYRSVWKPLGYLTSARKTYLMSLSEWQYAITNGMPLQEQQECYDRLVIPESKRILRQTLTSAARVHFKRPHVPLLITAGSTDHIIPASLNRTNYNRYTDQNSIRTFKEFKGKNHYVLGQEGWQEVAGYVAQWLDT